MVSSFSQHEEKVGWEEESWGRLEILPLKTGVMQLQGKALAVKIQTVEEAKEHSLFLSLVEEHPDFGTLILGLQTPGLQNWERINFMFLSHQLVANLLCKAAIGN